MIIFFDGIWTADRQRRRDCAAYATRIHFVKAAWALFGIEVSFLGVSSPEDWFGEGKNLLIKMGLFMNP